MFIKSENQRYIVNYKYIDENNIYAKVFFIKDKNRIIEKNSIHAKSGAGGERIAISNDGKYLVTAFYEKRAFIYNINNEGNYKLIKTKKDSEYREDIFIEEYILGIRQSDLNYEILEERIVKLQT